MPTFDTGTVEAVVEERTGLQTLQVRLGDTSRRAVLYTRYAAPARPGDRVVVNTTANELDLGSGGEDFVVWNLSHDRYAVPGGGHVMKLRYTPLQADVLSVEAPESPHHDVLASASSIDGMIVLSASLHSQLLPVVAAIRAQHADSRIAYVMTDGGALEASLSRTAARLRELEWLASVITVGHAIGGDLEAVNLYSGLLAARHIVGASIAVVGMGPGVVGTATPFGTTALELGMSVNAAAGLGGVPVAVVRMSSGDGRDRHAGVSHHAVTALLHVALVPCDVPVPRGHLDALGEVAVRHRVVEVDADETIDALTEANGLGLSASHMGRGPEADRLFFLAAGAAGLHAAALAKGE